MNNEISKERKKLCPQCSSPIFDEFDHFYLKSGIRIQKFICGECDYVFTSDFKLNAGLNPKIAHWMQICDLPKIITTYDPRI